MNRIRRCWAPIGAARGRRPTHPRIHLLVRCRLAQGWHLRLFDHADIEHSKLPGDRSHCSSLSQNRFLRTIPDPLPQTNQDRILRVKKLMSSDSSPCANNSESQVESFMGTSKNCSRYRSRAAPA
jgi:hypothetical protein